MYERIGKRALDVLLAAAAFVVLLPVMALVACAVRVGDGGPALFRQVRSGRHGVRFTLLKFRSMPVATPDVPSAAAGAVTITPVGRIIRRFNLDELPQLINILRGDMSLVGPRPALPTQTALLAARDAAGIARLRPGLTGLAQVNAYDGMSEGEKVRWETRYAGAVTMARDLAIITRTFGYLLRRPPVY